VWKYSAISFQLSASGGSASPVGVCRQDWLRFAPPGLASFRTAGIGFVSHWRDWLRFAPPGLASFRTAGIGFVSHWRDWLRFALVGLASSRTGGIGFVSQIRTTNALLGMENSGDDSDVKDR
jgi:hypothetical protein